MFEIIRIYTENGQEKKESMGFGTEGTLNTLVDIVAKYPTKYTGSRFEKKEIATQETEKKEAKKPKE